MEKYRKFADDKNGINPFINAPRLKKRNFILKLLSFPLMFIASLKLIIFLIVFFTYSFLRTILTLIGLARLLDKVFSFFFLCLFGVFSFSKDKATEKAEASLFNDTDKKKNVIILSSQSNIIDWIVLIYKYSPKFLQIVKHVDGVEDLLVELSYFQLLKYAAGIVIPTYSSETDKSKIKQFDLKASFSSPIVIFPEVTKTTREASLDIRSNIMDQVYDQFMQGKASLYCDITIFKFNYFCPNNTTDRKGFKNLLQIFSQLYNSVKLQTVKLSIDNFDTEKVDKELLKKFRNKYFYFDSLIQENLTYSEFRNNTVSLNCLKHLEFLDFFEMTSASTEYIKKKDK